MSDETRKNWTPEEVRGLRMPEQPAQAAALEAFASILDAEQRDERCVLPKELRDVEFFTTKCPNGWLVSLFRDPSIESLGDTLEAAIVDLARKLRER